MRLFPSPTKTRNTVDTGPAVTLKPSRWRRLFRKRKRRSSLSSTTSQTFSELSTVSLEDVRVMGHLEEIVLREDTPESLISDTESSISRKRSGESLTGGQSLTTLMKRDLFSERTVYVDALDHQDGEIQRYDTMKSVYLDALDNEQQLEIQETMEITVVAEIHDGTTPTLNVILN
jgi:hypothetical protein